MNTARAAAEQELSDTHPDSATYYGARVEKRLSAIMDRVASLQRRSAVDCAAELVAAMVTAIADFRPESPRFGFRLFKARSSGSSFDDLDHRLHQLAGELEACSNPLLAEKITLSRLREQLGELDADLAEYVAAGREAINEPSILDGSSRYTITARVEELMAARSLARQGQATIDLILQSVEQLNDRVEHLLNHALPLWQHHGRLLAGSDDDANARKDLLDSVNGDVRKAWNKANKSLTEALAGQ